MPVRAGTQFTPEQILEAGRRAEAEGRIEYALQFYRHLTDQHRGTREAHFATDALARLEALQPRRNGNGADYSDDARQPAMPPLEAGRRISIAPLDPAPRTEPIELPPPARDYRTTRALARLATWCGGPAIVLGIAATGAAVAAPGALTKLPFIGALFGQPSAGLTFAAAGLAMLVGGQLVRALLDTALATRDMAAIMRTQSGARDATTADHDEHPSRRRRNRRK